MTKPTREEVEQWISVTQSGLIGREYRDVFLKLPEILRAYIAQEEELVNERLRRKQEYWEQREVIDKLEAENQALKADGGKVSRFSVVVPSDLDAGIRGYTEEVHVILKSGEAIGDDGEFEEFIQPILEEWFDGGKVTIIKDLQP